MNNLYIWTSVAVIALVTALLRYLPFLIFNDSRKTPKFIEKLSKILPSAIIGMLVVYCVKSISFGSLEMFLPMVIACLIVGVLYVWKRNTLLSIICGTLSYMILVQFIF